MGKVINLFEHVNREKTVDIPGQGKFNFDIVGESNYQDTLDRLVEQKKHHDEPLVYKASLLYESDNPYDKNAVKVEIDQMIVGYLNRENAKYYRSQMTELGYEGYVVRCDAKIVGGWRNDRGQQAHYGVRLDMPTMGLNPKSQ
ncbi:MAG: hypothetical protein AAF438_02830 [Pseudomonadota bacterium]